ncbi:MAG: hypothetical protein P4L81_02120 [Candidatus Pacebacteria bacterium]|nr:hypothetical protein [Candidatus Paceibacterota bacterium]
MRRSVKILAIVAALVLAGYVAYSLIYPTISLRYRLTLDVDVDGVTHTGSGVVEVVYKFEPHPFNIDDFQFYPGHLHGNAITVDLGDRGLLFVVDTGSFLYDPGARQPFAPRYTNLRALPLRANDFDDGDPRPELVVDPKTIMAVKLNRQPIDFPPKELPMLVRFRFLGDPPSVEQVNPLDLASTFGPGVRLLRATFQITDEPVTPIPDIWPKWLVEYKDHPDLPIGSGPLMRVSFTTLLHRRDFKGE